MSLAQVGISLKPQHYKEILEQRPAIGWFEIHSENYMSKGGPSLAYLRQIREHYPISCHGVSLSLGGADPLDKEHLARLKALIESIDPIFVSEHLSWSRVDGIYLNDLLPLPYTQETLALMTRNILHAQEFLNRQLLIENPSSYMSYKNATMSEPEFLAALIKATDCRLLLDVNNVYVSAKNNHFDAHAYLAALPVGIVEEIHLAGHHTRQLETGSEFRIDDHGSEICSAVWDLYRVALDKFGVTPTLIEWDTQVPALSILLGEAHKCATIIDLYEQEERVANG